MSVEYLPQQTIKVNVDFYSDQDKAQLLQLFKNDPTEKRIRQFVNIGTEISVADFLAFYLFYGKNRGNPNFQNQDKIYSNLPKALEMLDGWIEWDGKSIHCHSHESEPPNEIREHIGEGIGLAVASQIHGFTHADWNRIIPDSGQGNVPRFDYEIASTGNQYIQVENKGAVVRDNRHSSDVDYHKKSIQKKKRKIASDFEKVVYPFPADVRYGTIVALDSRPEGIIKCWLVDPPAEKMEKTPQQFKLLTRMHFLKHWITLINPNSQLASSISNRLLELESLPDPFILDRTALKSQEDDANLHNFHYNIFNDPPLSNFFKNKSRVTDGPTGGIVFQISEKELFFIGIFQELVNDAIMQNFTKIMNYKHPYSGTEMKVIECVFNRHEFTQLRLPKSIMEDVEEETNYFKFYLFGQIHYCTSGLVFGILPI